MNRRRLGRELVKAFGLILTLLTFLMVYTPLLLIVILSFNDSTRGYQFEGFSFRWYAELFSADTMRDPIVNTVAVALLSTLIATTIGTLFAIGINAKLKKGRIRMMVLNNIPVVNPDIVTGISLMIIYSLLSFQLGFGTVLISHVFFSVPYVVLSIIPRLKRLDPNLFEAALDLGCSNLQAVRLVILPNIATGIVSGALMAFTMSIDDFVITYFTSGPQYMNVSTWLYATLSRGRSFTPAAYAYNVIIMIFTVAVIVFINVKRVRKEKRLV